MTRQLLVFGDFRKSVEKFRITIPDEAKVTFGPWSPPKQEGYSRGEQRAGTLRVYATRKADADIIFVQSGVTGYRDLSQVDYEEEIAKLEGEAMWKSDQHGYFRQSQERQSREWTKEALPEPD